VIPHAAQLGAVSFPFVPVIDAPQQTILGSPQPDLERIPRRRPARVGSRWEHRHVADPARRCGAWCLDDLVRHQRKVGTTHLMLDRAEGYR
jgi:hypothetical protein